MPPLSRLVLTVIACSFATLSVHANVTVPALFGDHMVLQGGTEVPVWGHAATGEKITITVGDKTASTVAGLDGKWKVFLDDLTPGDKPMTMTIAGQNTLTFNDVLIGDVWVCSGQSNMAFPMISSGHFGGEINVATTIPTSFDPGLRLFVVQGKTSITPVDDVSGKWEIASPQTVPKFSAVGYLFGRELRGVVKKPVGLIGTYWGGSPAQAFTSLSGLKKDPAFAEYVATYQKNLADYAKNSAAYATLMAQYKANSPAEKTKASKKLKPVPPDGGHQAPTTLYNGMIAPLIPYAIKGVIWYQGEANSRESIEYRKLFPTMIADWREKWGQGDFPFIFVQLARFNTLLKDVTWPYLREAQLMSLSVPHTGMAVAVDVGDPVNIHPQDKTDVAQRLVLAARHVAYGEDLVFSGPIFQSMKIDGNSAVLSFTQRGSGLTIGSAPWVAPDAQPIPTTSLVGFSIAGADHKFVPADAKIVGDTVVVSSPSVSTPVAVRYDWANTPYGNLYNKEALPASPFRTDDIPPDPIPQKGKGAATDSGD